MRKVKIFREPEEKTPVRKHKIAGTHVRLRVMSKWILKK
jgi:hypothetical protein